MPDCSLLGWVSQMWLLFFRQKNKICLCLCHSAGLVYSSSWKEMITDNGKIYWEKLSLWQVYEDRAMITSKLPPSFYVHSEDCFVIKFFILLFTVAETLSFSWSWLMVLVTEDHVPTCLLSQKGLLEFHRAIFIHLDIFKDKLRS